MEVDDEILGNRYEENELEGDFKSDYCCCYCHRRCDWRAGYDILSIVDRRREAVIREVEVRITALFLSYIRPPHQFIAKRIKENMVEAFDYLNAVISP